MKLEGETEYLHYLKTVSKGLLIPVEVLACDFTFLETHSSSQELEMNFFPLESRVTW